MYLKSNCFLYTLAKVVSRILGKLFNYLTTIHYYGYAIIFVINTYLRLKTDIRMVWIKKVNFNKVYYFKMLFKIFIYFVLIFKFYLNYLNYYL